MSACLWETEKHGTIVVRYVDSDYAAGLDKRRLVCYVFSLFECTISWNAIFQSISALSNTKVEYIVATKTVKEVVWL